MISLAQVPARLKEFDSSDEEGLVIVRDDIRSEFSQHIKVYKLA